MRLLTFGVEASDPQVPSGTSGALAEVETDPHSGKRSYELTAAASTTTNHRAGWTGAALAEGTNNRDEFLRFYYKKSANPTAALTIAEMGNATEGRTAALVVGTDGKLTLLRNGSTEVGKSAALPNGEYVYLEIRLRLGTTTGNGQIEARVNGESFAVNNATNLGAGFKREMLRVGVCNTGTGTGGATMRWDDIALNDASGETDTSWPGVLNPASAPTATTESADGIGGAIATLHGKVNPKGLPTTYVFEYGTTEAYGSESGVVEAGDGEEVVAVEIGLTGLHPATSYHFRISATNSVGTTHGADKTFETGVGPSGEPVANTFLALHEGDDPLSEYGASSTFKGILSSVSPGYLSRKALKAETTGIDGYARGQATLGQIDWLNGQEVRWGGAFYLPPGFYATKQGQIDIFRWDNFEQDEVTTDRGGLVMQTGDHKLRLVRIKEGEPDIQVTHNLTEGEEVIGPEIFEGRWYWPEVRQVLWHEDGLAENELWIDGVLIHSDTLKNSTRSDLVVSRYRAGLAATSGTQSNAISLHVDRVASGPMPMLGPLGRRCRLRIDGEWVQAQRRLLVNGSWVAA